jgi:HEAT repeat protein
MTLYVQGKVAPQKLPERWTMYRSSAFIVIAIAIVFCPFVASPTLGQDVQKLKQSKDVPGLVRLLRHQDGRVRSSAAVALSGTIREIEDSKTLAHFVLPLVDVTLRDPYSTVREYAGRALQHCLQNVDDVSILRGAVPPMVDTLNASEVEEKRRRYCAVQLSRVIPKIEHEPLLVQSMPLLLTATLDDPNEDVREYAGRALKSALPRIREEETLRAGMVALAETLKHEDVERRRYAAVLLSWMVSKVPKQEVLRAISSRVTEAAERDRDEEVREYARRAARDIQRRLQLAATAAKLTIPDGR